LTTPSSAAFGFGTGDFTAELWFYPLSTTAALLYDPRTASESSPSIGWGVTSSGKFQVTDSQVRITSTNTYTVGQWYHVAITRSGTTVTLWVNGTSQGTYTNSGNLPTTSVIIGNFISGGYSANGYLSDARITKGGALYTTTFTSPTAPLTTTVGSGTVSLLTSMTNAGIVDNAMMNDLETVGNAQISTSVKKYGTGSMAFDGTDDRVLAPDSPQLNMGSSSFTIEGWFYPTGNVTGGKGIFSKRANNGVFGGILFYFSSTGLTPRMLADTGGTWGVDITASSGFTVNTWNHFAVVRNGSSWAIYINGTSVGTATSSATIPTNTAAFAIMAESAAASEGTTAGYIDDFRITKGVARYVANFTPPTSQLQDQ